MVRVDIQLSRSALWRRQYSKVASWDVGNRPVYRSLALRETYRLDDVTLDGCILINLRSGRRKRMTPSTLMGKYEYLGTFKELGDKL